ncbi:MAG TPA: Type 1 glutamine amidotransferase-like domain-containing protein [Gemmatimonadaceae bacterium]|nr:Type 1 glutamine amidotransferase-like domain-containing protein [Gemmatimonadaceae bacterium]
MIRSVAFAVASALFLAAPSGAQTMHAAPRVGPPHGTVMVVGGGAQGPELYAKFIEAAGGPDALIIDVPTAGGDSTYPADWRGTRGLKAAGARNVVVLHTIDRRIADTDAFAEPISRAGGVWFEGGRQWHLVDSYAGTKTERAFHDVLARGGVVGGSSAGASILSSYMLRGARAGNATIMAPGYEAGFDFLHGVAIDQHVVTRDRLRDLADSLMPRRPDLLGISEDEGTAWIIRGDTAEIVGRSKAFVYGGRDPNDSGVPFLTLRPGDRYDLGARRVMHRAIDDSPLTAAFVDSLFSRAGHPGEPTAAVLVALDGKVLVNRSYGIPVHPRYTPTTTVPNFPLGEISAVIDTLARQLDASASGPAYTQLVTRRLLAPVGINRTTVSADGRIESNVDELYRWELGLEYPRAFTRDSTGAPNDAIQIDVTRGWRADSFGGRRRLASFTTADGRRGAFVRFPDQRASIIILTSSDEIDARRISEQIAERLFGAR